MNAPARPDVAVLCPQHPVLMEKLGRHFTLHTVFAEPDPLAALRALGPKIRGAVTGGLPGISTAQMEAMPKLEICTIHGVGLETTDLATARERGIVITVAPVLYDDVADLAVALALAACRQIPSGDRIIRAGKWTPTHRGPLGRKFTGMRTGIVGLGRIGMELVRRLEGFKAEIAYTDPVRQEPRYKSYPDALALAHGSDVLFLCAAGAPRGKAPPIIDRAILEAIGPRGVFVNIARGWLVDEEALVDTLATGKLGAAGLDVFDDEPRVPKRLFELDNVVLTPHVASWTEETVADMGQCVVDNLVSWFSGKGALTPVPGMVPAGREAARV